MLAAVFLFGVLPAEALQFALMKPIFADRFGGLADGLLRSTMAGSAYVVFTQFGLVLAKLAALDDVDEQWRSFSRLIATGTGRFVRACWLIIPYAAVFSMLTKRFGFLAGLPIYFLLVFFFNHYAVAGRSLKRAPRLPSRL